MSDNTAFVAIDDGYAQTKLWAVDGVSDKRLILPTAARLDHAGFTSLDGSSSPLGYETGGKRYAVGPSVVSESTVFDSFHLSDINRVMIHHALHLSGYSGRKVDLVCGLPMGNYFSAGKRNKSLISRKKENLAISVLPLGSDLAPIEISSVTVLAQGVSAWVDWAVDRSGRLREDIDDQPVAIVDIGGRTTDVATVMNGNVDQGRSGSENAGVLNVQQALQGMIADEFGISASQFPTREFDRALRERSIRLFGETHDVSALVEAAIATTEERIARFIERQVGGGADLAAVLFMGGGASLFSRLPGMYRHGKLMDDPEMANARGLWKYVSHMREEKQAA